MRFLVARWARGGGRRDGGEGKGRRGGGDEREDGGIG